LCEMMGIRYSCSGVLASALSMNKAVSKCIFETQGILTQAFQLVSDPTENIRSPPPAVVKPVDGGSAIGITIVKDRSGFKAAVGSALKYSRSALIERFVKGVEVTAPVLGQQVLPLIEIVPKRNF